MATTARPHAAAGLAATLIVAGALVALAAEPADVQFSAEATAVTIDVLVLDGQDRPVRGLTRDDFVILEDGRRQPIVGFEARNLTPGARQEAEARSGLLPDLATNAPASAVPGRLLVLLVDDLGISAATMSQLRPQLASWIQERADPRDEMTIMTTSGDAWWTDVIGRGRSDLLAVVARLRGKSMGMPESAGGMSTWEAYEINATERGAELQHEGGEYPEPFTMGATELDGNPIRIHGDSALSRVVQRWFDLALCVCVPHDCNVPACTHRAQMAAGEVYARWTQRAQATLTTLRNISLSLSAATGRKSILLLSEEFIHDSWLGTPLREAIVTLQRGNVAVYFLGTLGLTGSSTFSAGQAYKPRAQDLATIGTEHATLAVAGATELSEATGGVAITSSNDLAAGLERMAQDASSYYLLGFQPEKAPDGKWHKLEVKVARPGLKVRARRRYLAERPEDVARSVAEAGQQREKGRDEAERLTKRALPPAILTGSARGSLPLRLGVYLGETNHLGQARVQIVLEIDNTRVQVDKTSLPWRAALDVTVLVAGLDRAPIVPIDERLELSLNARDVGNGWWMVPREAWLPPGVAQVRVFARDTLSTAEGVVTKRLLVPDVDQPYLSTPIITDRTLPAPEPKEPPRLVPTAQRLFGRQRPLICQYEVFAFGGRTLAGVPQLMGSYTLQKADGMIVSSGEPTPIETDGFRAVRRITLPADRLEQGAYLLEVRVEDRLAQRTLVSRAPFVIEGDRARPSPESPPTP